MIGGVLYIECILKVAPDTFALFGSETVNFLNLVNQRGEREVC